MNGNKKSNESSPSCESQLNIKMSSSSSTSTFSVQLSIHNDNSSNEGTLFPLSMW